MIKLIVQVLDDVLRLSRGEFFSCHMTAVTQSLLQGIQGLNDSVLAGVDASVVAAVSIIQALPFGASIRRRKRSASAGSIAIHPKCFSCFASGIGRMRLPLLVHLCISRIATSLANIPKVGDLLTSIMARSDKIFA